MNKNWHLKIAKELKKRNNLTDDIKAIEAVVKSVSPLKLSIASGQILLDSSNLITSEWFNFRQNIDTSEVLSSQIPDLLTEAENFCTQAKSVTIVHSASGSPCEVANSLDYISQAISKISESITKTADEILALKMELNVGDKVLIVPTSKTDIYCVIDKV